MLQRLAISIVLLFVFAFGKGQECDIWYVTPNGAGAGTMASPASLQTALNGVAPGIEHVRMASGTYMFDQQLDLVNGVILEGGYDPATWEKSNNDITLIYRTNVNITPGPERIVAISAVGLNGFRLQDLDVEVEDAVGIGVSTYGIYVSGCSDYSIVRCKVVAGNGANGINGVPGIDGQNGVDGTDGQGGNQCGGGNTAGGVGGSSWSGGSAAGGNGGDGGQEGTNWQAVWGFPPWVVGQGYDGQVGQPGNGIDGGPGGIAGLAYDQTLPACWVILGIEVPQNCQAGGPSFGQPGIDALADGADGVNGANGVPSHAGGFFVPGDGLDGGDGIDGSGGGGGGGGGSFGEFIALVGTGSGPGGAGGGEGGQGGTGATGGSGGGGSFGIYIDNNGTGGVIGDCNVNSGIPGLGGIGGFPGGYGGFAGIGGQGGSGCGTGGDGGDGSDGGDGGAGGNGAAGEAQPIYQDPFGIPITQYNLNANVEPEVLLENTGCTYSDIKFTTNAFGIIQWYYEGGTNPLNDLGNGVTNQYYNQGYHDATMVSNGVPYQLSDFVHIFKDGTPFLPTIQASASTICPGETVNFSATWPSVFNVLDYRWDFGDPTSGNNTSSSANPSHTYADVGTYLIQLQTESPCCGWSKIDTFFVEVIPNVNPEVFITVSATEICEGETVSFGAVPYFGGPTPTYEWFHNNASSGVGPSYSPASIADGDEVYVQMTSSYPCPPNAQVNSEIVVMTVHPLPVIDCSNLSNTYLGAETQFDAQVSIGTPPFQFAWQLGDGAFSIDSTPSYEYGSTGTYFASVEVTDANGCIDVCDVQVDIILPPYVEANFTFDITQTCGTTTVQFTDISTGNPIAWDWDFGDGQTSQSPSPFVTYSEPGPYTVTLIANNGIFWDTIVMPNLVEIWEIPTASFYPDVYEQCDSLELRFFDESTNAVEWDWDFGDANTIGSNTSDLQNPYHTYNDPGIYTVNLTVTSDDGCTADAPPIDIEIFKTPISEFEVDSPVCVTDDVIFVDLSRDDVDIDEWIYRFGKDKPEIDFMNQDEFIHVFEEPGFYEVTQFVRNDHGCSDSSMKVVEVLPYPFASFYPDAYELFLPDTVMYFHNTSEHAIDDSSNWDFGNGTSVEHFRDPYGIYHDSGLFDVTLFVINEIGCEDDTTIQLRVWEQETFYIASAFTPNDDGVNDIFDIKERGITEWHMVIYDRWGKIVFESHDVKESWNGRNMFSGQEMPQGGYAYSIRLTWMSGRQFERMGTITLYR